MSDAPQPDVEVRVEVLARDVDPPGAAGRTLSLVRYTVPPGARLAPHHHRGVQLARITEGRLTYTVVEGTAIVRRGGAEHDTPVEGPATIVLEPGDVVTEVDGMVHFGADETDEPVVIEATLLTIDGEGLATPTDPS
ncbi:MAG: cupin domain-containing protein [Aquihabitans sp.]